MNHHQILSWQHPLIRNHWYAQEGKYYLVDDWGNIYGPFDSYEAAQELI